MLDCKFFFCNFCVKSHFSCFEVQNDIISIRRKRKSEQKVMRRWAKKSAKHQKACIWLMIKGQTKYAQMHTDAKSQFLFKNSILMKSTQTFELSRQKWDYWELDFLNKNWAIATVWDGRKCYHQSKTKIVISWKMPEASSSIKKGDFKIFSNYRKMYYVYLTSAAVTLCVFRVGMRENSAVTKNCLAAEFK